eukprot:Hpha_TRINITY_DN4660_c0_g1::TRINITY_DN4660_c0_g1_i1::g.97032::m.97032
MRYERLLQLREEVVQRQQDLNESCSALLDALEEVLPNKITVDSSTQTADIAAGVPVMSVTPPSHPLYRCNSMGSVCSSESPSSRGRRRGSTALQLAELGQQLLKSERSDRFSPPAPVSPPGDVDSETSERNHSRHNLPAVAVSPRSSFKGSSPRRALQSPKDALSPRRIRLRTLERIRREAAQRWPGEKLHFVGSVELYEAGAMSPGYIAATSESIHRLVKEDDDLKQTHTCPVSRVLKVNRYQDTGFIEIVTSASASWLLFFHSETKSTSPLRFLDVLREDLCTVEVRDEPSMTHLLDGKLVQCLARVEAQQESAEDEKKPVINEAANEEFPNEDPDSPLRERPAQANPAGTPPALVPQATPPVMPQHTGPQQRCSPGSIEISPHLSYSTSPTPIPGFTPPPDPIPMPRILREHKCSRLYLDSRDGLGVERTLPQAFQESSINSQMSAAAEGTQGGLFRHDSDEAALPHRFRRLDRNSSDVDQSMSIGSPASSSCSPIRSPKNEALNAVRNHARQHRRTSASNAAGGVPTSPGA